MTLPRPRPNGREPSEQDALLLFKAKGLPEAQPLVHSRDHVMHRARLLISLAGRMLPPALTEPWRMSRIAAGSKPPSPNRGEGGHRYRAAVRATSKAARSRPISRAARQRSA